MSFPRVLPDQRLSECQPWTDHNPIVLGSRSWRHGFRLRYHLRCLRCDRNVGTYRTREDAAGAKEWARMERWRRRGLPI